MREVRRTFTDEPAVRSGALPWIAYGGPSGGGKTLSALRTALGVQRVTGGDIWVVDTEADRARIYAPKHGEKANPPVTFDFRHVPLRAPFSSLDYLAAVRHCHARGARIVIIDSLSHEHEGPGGHLEQHESELQRLAGEDQKKAERLSYLAWVRPKAERRRMLNEMLQLPIAVIGCFRTKDKIKPQRQADPLQLGDMPITGDEVIYEFPVRILLRQGSDGVPALNPEGVGEKTWVRVPIAFRDMVVARQIDEALGERIARWAQRDGTTAPAGPKPAASPPPAPDDRAALLERARALIKRLPASTRLAALNAAWEVPDWKALEKLDNALVLRGIERLEAAPQPQT